MNFKTQIRNKGIKITFIADKLGISQPLLSMYLNGTRNMPNEIKTKVEKLLK